MPRELLKEFTATLKSLYSKGETGHQIRQRLQIHYSNSSSEASGEDDTPQASEPVSESEELEVEDNDVSMQEVTDVEVMDSTASVPNDGNHVDLDAVDRFLVESLDYCAQEHFEESDNQSDLFRS